MLDLIKSIEYWNGTVPKKQIKEIIDRRRESVPLLIDILKKVLKEPEKFSKDNNYIGHKVAIYLLAQFKCSEAFEDIIKFYSLEESLAYDLLGYNLTYDESRVLASTYNGNLSLLTNIIEDKNIYEVHRVACVDALKILALQAVVDRKKVIDYYKELMRKSKGKSQSEVECAVFNSLELYPEELMDEIERLYAEKRIDESIMFKCSFKQTLEMKKEDVIECYSSQTSNSFIEDILNEMIFWEEISGEIY
ncbi:DUF1186 domain-containing protein [Oceanirhabdus sp. W0125-5]|uniref:DUF1186 domain-containing protein n=1 Tax=Oceanirhabdus sp. W0125-5 TaxID=2999116 RepID=UPI0022F2AEBE|nr:DUF1186 domain-containing protein [Oceanirhabdus sp. W0125-5]WBW95361.1 DUF1186 domain-containing protein [Oceanirhabdus sp. W0125-5]